MLRDVVVRRRRRRAHAPAIHAASHVDHEKRDAWFPISMHACGSFSYSYCAPLGGPSGHRSSSKIPEKIDSEDWRTSQVNTRAKCAAVVSK